MAAQNAENIVRNLLTDPGIHAVHGDNVEIGKIRIVAGSKLRETRLDETDVLDPRFLRQGAGFLDMGGIEIDAHEVAIRICGSEQQRAVAAAAAELAIAHPWLQWRGIAVDQSGKGQVLRPHLPIEAQRIRRIRDVSGRPGRAAHGISPC